MIIISYLIKWFNFFANCLGDTRHFVNSSDLSKKHKCICHLMLTLASWTFWLALMFWFFLYKIDINPVRIIVGSALFRLLVMIYISTLQFSVSIKGMNRGPR